MLPLCLQLSSCSDNDAPDNPESTDFKVEMEIGCTFKNTCAGVKKVQISWLRPGSADEADCEPVEGPDKWTKTVAYDGIPEGPMGIFVNPLIEEDVKDGQPIKLDYEYSCKVTLRRGEKIVDCKSLSHSQDFEFVYDETQERDLTDGLAFAVTPQGIKEAEIEDDPDSEIEQKTSDEDACLINGRVYCYSVSDVATNDAYLYDNMLARFSERRGWDGLPARKGDFIFLYKNDIEKAPADVIKESLDNGAIIIVDCLESYAQFAGFCKSQGLFNPYGDEERDVSHTMFVVANSVNGISAAGNDNYRGVFFVLDADGALSDYEQGLMVDNAVNAINKIITPQPFEATPRARGVVDDLSEFISATKYMFVERVIFESELFDKDGKGDYLRTNIYSNEYDVWNVFSLSEDRNYYCIHQEFIGNFAPCYFGIIKSFNEKKCGWYASYLDLSLKPRTRNGTHGMQIHRYTPKGTQESESYSSGFSANLGGTLGVQGGKGTHTGTGGISFNSSQSYNIKDVTVYDKCSPEEDIRWLFDFKGPKFKFRPWCKAGASISEGANVGRNTFSAGMDYLISFPASVQQPEMVSTMDVQLNLKYGTGVSTEVSSVKERRVNIFRLPSLSQEDFK